jgi:hypothetical protein
VPLHTHNARESKKATTEAHAPASSPPTHCPATSIDHIITTIMAQAHNLATNRGEISLTALEGICARILKTHYNDNIKTETCINLMHAHIWAEHRQRPFIRLLVKPFAHFFPSAQNPRPHFERTIIPGFSSAIQTMIGLPLYQKYEAEMQALALETRDLYFGATDWDYMATLPDVIAAKLTVLQCVSEYMLHDLPARMHWLTEHINTAYQNEQKTLADLGHPRKGTIPLNLAPDAFLGTHALDILGCLYADPILRATPLAAKDCSMLDHMLQCLRSLNMQDF